MQVNGLRQASFKEMLQHYKKQPQCKPEVFKTVIIEQSLDDLTVSKTGDIIEFYNAVLIPTVKSFVLECAPPARMPALCTQFTRETQYQSTGLPVARRVVSFQCHQPCLVDAGQHVALL